MGFLTQFGQIVLKLISFYSFLIWIRIFLSWIFPYPREGSFTYFFARLVDPYLNLFRSRYFRVGMLDFSPIIAIVVLNLVQTLLQLFVATGTIRLSWLLVMVISFIWQYAFSIFFFMFIIILILRIIGVLGNFQTLERMSRIVQPIAYIVNRLLFKNRIVKESTGLFISLALSVCLYFLMKYLFSFLIILASRIPF